MEVKETDSGYRVRMMNTASYEMDFRPEEIVQRFARGDKARARQAGGTGLGRSSAKEIVDRHEGALELVDRNGPGLSVRMELNIEGPSHDERK